MRSLGPCESCLADGRKTEATLIVFGEPSCASCMRKDKKPARRDEESLPAPKEVPPGMCARGCGEATHRGRCKVVQPLPMPTTPAILYAKPIELPPVEAMPIDQPKGSRMDVLKAVEVDFSDIPNESIVPRKEAGRAGELWRYLQELNGKRPLKVESRDIMHAGHTVRHMKQKAQKAGRTLNVRRAGKDLYLWLEAKQVSNG